MFAPKKGNLSINPGGSPEFQVQYIGAVDTYQANGMGCTNLPVQKIWDRSAKEEFLKHVLLTIGTRGIQVKFISRSKQPDMKFDIKNISYCCAQQNIHTRIFSWVCKSSNQPQHTEKRLQCHAVLCSSKEKAQTLALVTSRAFHIAYREWKIEKDKQGRQRDDKARIAKLNRTYSSDEMMMNIESQSFSSNGSSSNCNEFTNEHNSSLFFRLENNESDFQDGVNKINRDSELLGKNNKKFQNINSQNGSSSSGTDIVNYSKVDNSLSSNLTQTLNSLPTDDSAQNGRHNSHIEMAAIHSNHEISSSALEAAMAQMNIVEEDELSFTENNFAVVASIAECINEEECVDHL